MASSVESINLIPNIHKVPSASRLGLVLISGGSHYPKYGSIEVILELELEIVFKSSEFS